MQIGIPRRGGLGGMKEPVSGRVEYEYTVTGTGTYGFQNVPTGKTLAVRSLSTTTYTTEYDDYKKKVEQDARKKMPLKLHFFKIDDKSAGTVSIKKNDAIKLSYQADADYCTRTELVLNADHTRWEEVKGGTWNKGKGETAYSISRKPSRTTTYRIACVKAGTAAYAGGEVTAVVDGVTYKPPANQIQLPDVQYPEQPELPKEVTMILLKDHMASSTAKVALNGRVFFKNQSGGKAVVEIRLNSKLIKRISFPKDGETKPNVFAKTGTYAIKAYRTCGRGGCKDNFASGIIDVQGKPELTIDVYPIYNNGQNDSKPVNVQMGLYVEAARFTLTAGIESDITISQIRFRNSGTAASSSIKNFSLWNYTHNIRLAEVAQLTSDSYLTFDKIGKGGKGFTISAGEDIVLRVQMDIVGGPNETARFVLQEPTDIKAHAYDASVVVKAAAKGRDPFFPIGDTGNGKAASMYVNKIKIASGLMALSLATDSPTGKIAAGAEKVTVAHYELKPIGEDMELQSLTYRIDRSPAAKNNELTGLFMMLINEKGNKNKIVVYTASAKSLAYNQDIPVTLTTFPHLDRNKTYTLSYQADISSDASQGATYRTWLDVTKIYRTATKDIIDPPGVVKSFLLTVK
ncbi:hypothetical protein HYV71_04220 [Candidatus Uhrbacteria bacterium]|nr:hypothetical protein [Candidatus Uhrbacteria bacterium]